jgi:uncharacterized protein YacL
MIRRESIVPASRVNRKELILSAILKVYAIREAVEERSEEHRFRDVPLLGSLATKLSSTALSKDQHKDATAFITATCTTDESLKLMEQITGFKSKLAVNRPIKILFSIVGLILPLLLVIAAEALMFYAGVITQMPYFVIALALIVVAVIASISLFAYLGYDDEYRRGIIERSIWKAMHDECVRKLKKSGVIKTHRQLTPKAKPFGDEE